MYLSYDYVRPSLVRGQIRYMQSGQTRGEWRGGGLMKIRKRMKVKEHSAGRRGVTKKKEGKE